MYISSAANLVTTHSTFDDAHASSKSPESHQNGFLHKAMDNQIHLARLMPTSSNDRRVESLIALKERNFKQAVTSTINLPNKGMALGGSDNPSYPKDIARNIQKGIDAWIERKEASPGTSTKSATQQTKDLNQVRQEREEWIMSRVKDARDVVTEWKKQE